MLELEFDHSSTSGRVESTCPEPGERLFPAWSSPVFATFAGVEQG